MATQKLCRREISLIEELCRIFLVPSGYEPTVDYQMAVQRCLGMGPDALCMPFFGTYVHQLRALFFNFPGSVVIPEETITNHALEFITTFYGISHAHSRISFLY